MRTVDPDLEVEVRAGRQACAPHVADEISQTDVCPVSDGDGRLMGVQGGEAAAVVDDDGVPVPTPAPGVASPIPTLPPWKRAA